MVAGAAASLALAACGATHGASGAASGPAPKDHSAFVTAAIRNTLAQKSADVTAHGTLTEGTHTVPLSGTGQVDMGTDDMQLTLSASGIAGRSATIQTLLVGGTGYLQLDAAGHDVFDIGGRHWLQLPFSLPTAGGSGSPLDALRLMAAAGDHVTPLGPSTVDGRAVQGYSVVPTRQALEAGVDRILAHSTLTPAQIARAKASAATVSPPTSKLWFSADQLLRRQDVTMQLALPGAGGAEQLTVDFSHYGVPVHIAAPAASDVITSQQFQQAMQALGGAGGSSAG